jgi:hypothetical protein
MRWIVMRSTVAERRRVTGRRVLPADPEASGRRINHPAVRREERSRCNKDSPAPLMHPHRIVSDAGIVAPSVEGRTDDHLKMGRLDDSNANLVGWIEPGRYIWGLEHRLGCGYISPDWVTSAASAGDGNLACCL